MNDYAKPVMFGCLFVVAVPLLVFGCYGCSRVTVSEGYREAVFRKLSHTGVIWKTWEAEFTSDLLIQREGGLRPEVFTYTVPSSEVREKMNAIPPGVRVRVHYTKKLAPWVPDGETQYFVRDVEVLK